MKVLFIYSLFDIQSVSKPLRYWSGIQFGISYVSSVLKSHGNQTQLLVLGSTKWRAGIRLLDAYMEEFDPEIICFTAVSSQYAFIERVARFTKQHWPDKFLIAGGVHATLKPDEVAIGPFDAVCVGEGELPMKELCEQLEKKHTPHGIANLWIKCQDNTLEKNPIRPFLQDLDSLPFPDLEMWLPWMEVQNEPVLKILLGRGCPYDCTYCSNHALRKVASGKYVRMRSPENIIQEISMLHNTYPDIRRIYFEVESIALNKHWTFDLCKKLEEFNLTIDHVLSYHCNFRISPHSSDEKLFIAFQKSNFYQISIGLEAGSERIRRDVLHRNYSNEDFLSVVSMARKHGLKLGIYNMIGLPGETLDEHLETVALNRQCQPDENLTSIFFPYPGTELYTRCLDRGLLKKRFNPQMERRQVVIENPRFTKAQIERAYTWFNYQVYKGHKPRWYLLMQVIITSISSNATAHFVFRQTIRFWRHYVSSILQRKRSEA